MDFEFSFTNDWQVSPSLEHSFVAHIREAVRKYRIRSASHFSIPIEVSQAIHPQSPSANTLAVYVGFYNFGTTPIFAVCQPRTLLKRGTDIYPKHIEVLVQGKFVPLGRFISANFQKFNAPIACEVMYQWWRANGKTFQWTLLPTELKERIIYFCMHRSERALQRLSKNGYKNGGLHEVHRHFGQWTALRRVSHQVRAISLRLCFMGLHIKAENTFVLKQSIRRLDGFSQLLEPNNASIATDEKTSMLAHTYQYHPKIYPHLDQYATLGHGIRKITFHVLFLEAFHFFKVKTAGFAQYWQPYYLTYEVFERLPRLNELNIYLPDSNDSLTDKSRQCGPQIFHDKPCPRILHRLIYERAANVLAKYSFATLHGFLDEAEELRYNTLRKKAIDGLRFSEDELEELYKEEGGGIELKESVLPGVERKHTEQAIIYDDFWPPQCKCKAPCRSIFQ
ncbi:n-acetyltransferase 5 [Pyrenophora seminiperda CCB06]|uniref:N-acetyltransferase 5 n=1 Tax=Pyrenophora seminiperda CCB06 TaxID=1302712 RepID=A0A3M7MCG2_9PLEO|nr:n-acetyltransferase 5 [Pyrenophora seminiperda CCB06]